jgi:hypothetical protein
VRWFDGENWSEYRQAADPGAEATADLTAGSATDTTATIGSAAGIGAAGPGYDPYAATASYEPYAPAAAAPAAPGGVSTEVRADAGPAPVAAATSTTSTGPAGAGSHAGAGRAKLDRRVVLIAAIVAVVVIGLVVGAIMLFSGGRSCSPIGANRSRTPMRRSSRPRRI